MDKYETIEVVGEGSYGIVMKCRHKETKQIVAIKKFLETEEDPHIRKMAFREIRMLKKLRHDNLVNLIEVFRRRKRFYLVFEYLDHTVLDELESAGGGLGYDVSKRHLFQILRGLNFCHTNHIMHRDIKPENVLVSPNGIIKLCDFGFARFFTGPNESCTDYVATRWYRAPELLVGDTHYGKAIDVWAVGCLYAEMVCGDPLFPGESDIDQLYKIIKMLGSLCTKHQMMVGRNNTRMLRRTSVDDMSVSTPAGTFRNLRIVFPSWNTVGLDFLSQCLRMDPDLRPGCSTLLQHPLFTQDGFSEKFSAELRVHIEKEAIFNPLILKREEMRRLSVLSTDEAPPKICQSGIGRWQINMIKDIKADKFDAKSVEISDNQSGNQPSTPAINRLRDITYLGSTSMSIKRLEPSRMSFLPESGGCMLPAIPFREPTGHIKTNTKRRRPDIPSFG